MKLIKKNIKGKEINFNFTDDNNYNNIILFEKYRELNPKEDDFDKNNIYPPEEEVLLLLHKICIDNNYYYNIEISGKKLNEKPLKDFIVLGRCYYNQKTISDLVNNNIKGNIKILDLGKTFNY